MRLYAHHVKQSIAPIRALSDGRQPGHPSGVEKPLEPKAETTLAENLAALRAYHKARNDAKDRDYPAMPASDKALSEASGASRKTVEAGRKGTRPLGIDNIQKIAHAYGLRAHQLLMPGLDPSKPPIVITEAQLEAEVARRVKEMFDQYSKLYGEAVNEREARPDGRSPRKPFADLQTPAGEPDNAQAGAETPKAKARKR